jgi:hypothetical protein
LAASQYVLAAVAVQSASVVHWSTIHEPTEAEEVKVSQLYPVAQGTALAASEEHYWQVPDVPTALSATHTVDEPKQVEAVYAALVSQTVASQAPVDEAQEVPGVEHVVPASESEQTVQEPLTQN